MYTTLKKESLYIQLFITDRNTGKKSQFSCDDIVEADEIIRKKMPKFLEMAYYNSFGLVGTAFHYLNFKTGNYTRYKKESNKDNPRNNK